MIKNNKNEKPEHDHSSETSEEKEHKNFFEKYPFLIWIAIFAMGAYLFQMRPGPQRATITYSSFQSLLNENKVTEVTIKGQSILGKLDQQHELKKKPDSQKTIKTTFFRTTMPQIEDASLLQVLKNSDVEIKAEEMNQSWLTLVFLNFLPWLLFLGLLFYGSKRFREGLKNVQKGPLQFQKSKAKRFQLKDVKTTFDDVAGVENAKADLKEIVDFLQYPKKYQEIGANLPKGVLLTGAPGTGKTLLARACAGESNVPFFSISGSEFIEMFVGVGAARVRDIFEKAKKESPSIVFIDEIDSIGRSRGTGLGGGHDEREQTLNQILSEMDGFEPSVPVIIMAATNRPDVLDAALTRPGRFDRQIMLELPQRKARERILKLHAKKIKAADSINYKSLAAGTMGFSGADIQNLVNEAALLAARKNKNEVAMADFEQARDKILLGSKKEEELSDKQKELVAYHESGHALMSYLLSDISSLRKVTIIPRGKSLGATEQVISEEEESYNVSREKLEHKISILLGGRVAEEIIFNDVTTGAENDLKKATHLARKMVANWGMSEKLGAVSFRMGEEHQFLGKEIMQEKDYSEETARLIDSEIFKLLKRLKDNVREQLEKNREQLENLAENLLEHETLGRNEINDILNKKAQASA